MAVLIRRVVVGVALVATPFILNAAVDAGGWTRFGVAAVMSIPVVGYIHRETRNLL